MERREGGGGSQAGGELTAGHARARLAIDRPHGRGEAWRLVVDRSLNGRQTGRMVRTRGRRDGDATRSPRPADVESEALAESMRRTLGTKVTLRRSKRGAGSVTIHFYSDEELEGLLARLIDAAPQ